MKCPNCGAENAQGAKYCSLCMQKLREPEAGASWEPAGGGYVAPGEWRGDADTLRPQISGVVTGKVRRYRAKMLVIGLLLAAVAAVLLLGFTLWGNPSPGKVSGKLIGALNARDRGAFLALFEEKNHAAASDLYAAAAAYLGDGGRFEKVDLGTVERDEYEAVVRIESAELVSSSGSTRRVSRSDNLRVVLESHRGRWYVIPQGTVILP